MSPGVTIIPQMDDDRIKEFRQDPQKMSVTTEFVDDIVEKAKNEAMKRMKEKERKEEGMKKKSWSVRMGDEEKQKKKHEYDIYVYAGENNPRAPTPCFTFIVNICACV